LKKLTNLPTTQKITLYEDNQSCIALAQPEVNGSKRTKHISPKSHLIRDYIDKNEVELVYCKTEDMIADALTKGLSGIKLKALVDAMELKDYVESVRI